MEPRLYFALSYRVVRELLVCAAEAGVVCVKSVVRHRRNLQHFTHVRRRADI